MSAFKAVMRKPLNLPNGGLTIAIGLLLILAIGVHVVTGVNYFNGSNLSNLSRTFSILAIVAIGQMLAIVSGGMDLSVGSTMSATGIMAALVMQGDNSLMIPTVLLCLAFGALVGLVNGLLITQRKVPPFIATLGTGIILNGGRLMITQGVPSGKVPENLRSMSNGELWGVPSLLLICGLVSLFFIGLLGKTAFGRRLYATGTNPVTAHLTGIRTGRVIVGAYVLCGMLAALAGVLLLGYTGSSTNLAGKGFELDSIAAAALGGALIGGGVGTVSGTLMGVFILITLTNLSLLANLPIESQMLVKGIIIVAAVWVSNRKSNRSSV